MKWRKNKDLDLVDLLSEQNTYKQTMKIENDDELIIIIITKSSSLTDTRVF